MYDCHIQVPWHKYNTLLTLLTVYIYSVNIIINMINFINNITLALGH